MSDAVLSKVWCIYHTVRDDPGYVRMGPFYDSEEKANKALSEISRIMPSRLKRNPMTGVTLETIDSEGGIDYYCVKEIIVN